MKEEKDFLRWYNQKVRESAQEPPRHVWENINTQLDINEVWGKIENDLDEKDRLIAARSLIYRTIAALLFLGLGVVGSMQYYNRTAVNNSAVGPVSLSQHSTTAEEEQTAQTNNSRTIAENQEVRRVKEQQIADPVHTPVQEDLTRIKQKAIGDNNLPPKGAIDGFSEDEKAFLKDPGRQNTLTNDSDVEFLQPLYPVMAYPLPDLKLIHADSLQEPLPGSQSEEKYNQQNRGIKLGITASAKNIWLLNAFTYEGLEKHTLNTTVPDFGKDLGVVVDYTISPKLGLQAEAMVSEAGQKYQEYLNGKYVTRTLDLEYYAINMMVKYRFNRLWGETGSYFLLGLYGSSLKSAFQVINDEAVDQKDHFSPHDFGGLLGYEFNREIMPDLIVSSGLRFQYGFMNINRGSMTSTNTGSLALNFAIKYKIGGSVRD